MTDSQEGTRNQVQNSDKTAAAKPALGGSSEMRPKIAADEAISAGAKDTTVADEELSPAFKLLASPQLPPLPKQNRAKLLMQSPTRLHFYWSIRTNPYQTLSKAIGSLGNYMLALKLVDVDRNAETVLAAETEGSHWFNVESNGRYQVEVGFYSPSRPFIRLMFSNTVETPRRSPSPRAAASSDWRVTSSKFAEVLEVAGFVQDAFDVAIAGDDAEGSATASRNVLAGLLGEGSKEIPATDDSEIRFALFAIAAGAPLEHFRWRLSPALFAVLEKYAGSITRKAAMSALGDEFNIEPDDIEQFEESSAAVFGASLVHFPRRQKTLRIPRYSPVSSAAFRPRSDEFIR